MKKNLQTLAMPAAIAASFLFGCSAPPHIVERTASGRPSVVQAEEGYDTLGRKWADETYVSPPQVFARNDYVIQHFTGTITDIDYSTREVTLQDPQGRMQTFVVDKSVPRLDEAKVGDKVSVDYYPGLNTEIREATAQEAQNPPVVLEATGRPGREETRAAVAMRQLRAVATIEALDRPTQTLTVKSSRGTYFTTRVADPSRLEQLHIGETIVLTFTEPTAVSLKPVGNE